MSLIAPLRRIDPGIYLLYLFDLEFVRRLAVRVSQDAGAKNKVKWMERSGPKG